MVWIERRVTFTLGSVLLLSLAIGCGGGGDGFKGTRGSVSGTVKFEGKPVPQGSVVMFQSNSGAAYLATGPVKADGKYELVYQGAKSLPAVKYGVQISPPPGSGTPVKMDPSNPAAISNDKLLEASKGVTLPFPAKYTGLMTSGLTYEVKKGANTANFDLVP